MSLTVTLVIDVPEDRVEGFSLDEWVESLPGHVTLLEAHETTLNELADALPAMCDDEGYLKDKAFRQLDSKEEQEFRQWARENPNHENRKDPKLCHPVVRDEWRKIDEGKLNNE